MVPGKGGKATHSCKGFRCKRSANWAVQSTELQYFNKAKKTTLKINTGIIIGCEVGTFSSVTIAVIWSVDWGRAAYRAGPLPSLCSTVSLLTMSISNNYINLMVNTW